ncbi:MAG TPA: hypothetical protein VF590_25975, partial [Isosphaeraceae bacterium]
QIARFGRVLGGFLPYSTPLSVHSAPSTWPAGFDDLPAWHDHIIIQHKLRDLSDASDTIRRARRGPRAEPVLDDELSYQGAGDKHSEADTIEAHLGVFLGGGYGTTGWKTGEKLGHYFWGGFDPAEHSAADALAFLRRVIDVHITFWRLEPSEGIFEGLDPGFRVLAWPGREYVLGTDQPRRRLVAVLPRGRWAVARHDVIAQTSAILAESASGRFEFDAPASRAVLFHFQKMK